jgi:hypothetical protein
LHRKIIIAVGQMRIHLNFNVRSLARLARFASCLLSVAMIVGFPLAKNHDFAAHFRNAEVRRAAVRHTSLSQAEDNRPERVVRGNIQSTSLIALDIANFKPRPKFVLVSPSPIRRLLLRLKSGPSGANGQDPLI